MTGSPVSYLKSLIDAGHRPNLLYLYAHPTQINRTGVIETVMLEAAQAIYE